MSGFLDIVVNARGWFECSRVENENAFPNIPIRFRDASALDTELKAFASEPKTGLLIAAEGATNRTKIIGFAADHRLPAVYPFRNVLAEGGLAFYGIDFVDIFSRALLDQILRRANPASLPIQSPTKFELVIRTYLKIARHRGRPISVG